MRFIIASLVPLLGAAIAAPAEDPSSKSTLTYTATTSVNVTSTVTGTAVYTSYVTSYTGPTSTSYFIIRPHTSTSTETLPTTVYSRPAAASTTSVPAPPGFFPLLSASEYTDAISIVKQTDTSTSVVTYDPSPSSTTVETITTNPIVVSTITQDDSTIVFESPTTSVLSSSATKTAYEACQTNNLASKIPTGQDLSLDGVYHVITHPNQGDYFFAEDCCAHCMETEGCAGGWFSPNQPTGAFCTVFTLNPDNATQVCDSKGLYSLFTTGESQATTAFNGPCGGWAWDFRSEVYFE